MSTVLVAGDLEVRDPGTSSLLAVLDAALPGRTVVVVGRGRSVERRGRQVVSSGDLRRLLTAVRGADGVVLVNGALHGRTSGPGGGGLRLALAARVAGIPVALLSAGVGRTSLRTAAARLRVRALVRLADLVVLRDSASAMSLEHAGAPVPFRIGADLTWLAFPDAGRAARPPLAGAQSAPAAGGSYPRGVLVVLDARNAPAGLPERLGAALAAFARATGTRTTLLPWRLRATGGDDLDLARAVAAHTPGATVTAPPADLVELHAMAVDAGLVLSTRLRPLQAAAAAGVPFVALGAGRTGVALARDLGQTAVAIDARPDAIEAALHGADVSPSAAPVAERIDAARRSVALLRVVLGRGRTDDDLQATALPLEPVQEVLR